MRLAVESGAYTGAARSLRSGNEVAALHYGTLTQQLAGFGGMAGDDRTSEEFARQYDAAAQEAVDGLDALVDAFATLSGLTGQSHVNHRRADVAATYGHPGGDADDLDFQAGTVDVGSVSVPSSLGANDADLPQFWNEIMDYLEGYAWPNADTGRLRSAASAWRSAAEDVDGLTSSCDSAVSRLEGQDSPEIPLAAQAVKELRNTVVDLAAELRSVGDACDEYAASVEEHRAIIIGIVKDMAVEAGISIVAGTIVGLVTLGGGAVAGGAIAGWRIAAAARKILTALRALEAIAKARAVARLTSVVDRVRPLRKVLERLRSARRLRKGERAATAAGDNRRVLTRADLSQAQLSNVTRYTRKLPASAEPTIITRGADGTVRLSTKVPGRVPGSYAIYDKVVDASGTTIGYTKTTVAPDGTIIHIKDKLTP